MASHSKRCASQRSNVTIAAACDCLAETVSMPKRSGRVEVLDHGYVELIETWGSEERIIEAARMSTSKGFEGWGGGACCMPCLEAERLSDAGTLGMAGDSIPVEQRFRTYGDRLRAAQCVCRGSGRKVGDEKLLRYLWEHRHHTPFEMAGAIFEVKAPIFVFREWHRHRTQSFNELSARYTPLPNENYVPSTARCIPLGDRNRQAGSATTHLATDGEIADWITALQLVYADAQAVYQRGLDLGIPKELARLPVPVARYSRMRASANLRNWLHFLSLRQDPNAQAEIRAYADAVAEMLRTAFPRTLALFDAGDRVA